MLQALLKALPLLRPEYAAKLVGVNGFTGRGSIGYSPNKNGARKLSVQLHGLAGREAELVIDNAPTATIAIKKGHAGATIASDNGDKLPELPEGAQIEVRQNGDTVLSGVLTRN